MTTQIDPTDYVESETSTLIFPDIKQQAKFELGVCMAVHKWEELATAVDNSWGGPRSSEKRDWISGIVIELFAESKIVDVQLIEETLLYAMVDEFDTQVDNDSALEIADLIVRMYRDVMRLEYGVIDGLYERWVAKGGDRKGGEGKKVHVENDPNNPDVSDDEEEEEEEEEEDDHDGMDVDEPMEEAPQLAGPIVDDDGFELVQSKGRRRR
ncbi:Pre-rRNA-processing protein TSR2 [Candida viswanathii]|uniref:Pre-rRNA-processing protein TSR2 n=1 Tax=Candida viswanathii TaxID=5486 RepID=A0A367Y7B1_9ASCO|nr:Pre-rRNA-processing protein TSR2 [Candida viswanathii]